MTDVMDKGPELQADTLELINSELADLLARQDQASARVDTKAALLVGYAAAAASFLAVRHSQPLLTWLALAAFAIAAGFGIGAFAISTYQELPQPRRLFNGYARRPKTAALAALAARRVGAFESNVPKNRRKAMRWRISLTALMVGVALMVGALYVHTGSHDRSVSHGRGPAATTGLTAKRH